MKKWIVPAIVAAVLAALAAWYFILQAPSSPPLSAFIPERAALVLIADDLGGFWESFSAGDLWREIAGSALGKKAGFPERIAAFAAAFEAAAGFPLDRDNFRELAGREIAVALLPEANERPASLLLATRVGAKTRALELVSRWQDRIRSAGDRSLKESASKDFPWVEIRPTADFPFSSAYAFSGDCLLFLVSPVQAGKGMEEALALARGKGEGVSIASLGGFRETWALLPPKGSPRLAWHLSVDRLAALWGGDSLVGIEAPGVREWEALMENIRRRLKIVRSVGGGVWLERGLKGFVRREIDPDRAKGVYGSALPRPISRRFDSLRFAPAGALMVWAGAEDFSLAWERARRDWGMLKPALLSGGVGEEGDKFLRIAREFEQDLLPALSDEAVVVLNRLASSGLIPLPDVAAAFKAKDAAAADSGMEKFVAALLGAGPATVSRRGKWEVKTVPAGPFGECAWTVAEGYLVAGTSAGTVEKALKAFLGAEGRLVEEPGFRRLAAAVPPEGGRFLYLDTARLIEEIARIVRWAQAFASPEKPEGELLSAEELIESLRPWRRLWGLAVRARAEQNVVIDDFYWYSEEKSFFGAPAGD